MPDRSTAPLIHPVRNLSLPRPRLLHLKNGIPLWILHFPDQPFLRIDAAYRAGRPEEHKKLVARATNRLLREGTTRRTGAAIAETIDFYGGSFGSSGGLDIASLSISCLKKYEQQLLPLFAEILLSPAFPEAELETFKRTNIQALQIELQKVEVLAYRSITEQIFGKEHPYGYNSDIQDYRQLTIEDLKTCFATWYTPSNCRLIACGNIDEATIRQLDQLFGHDPRTGPVPSWQSRVTPAAPRSLRIPHADALQSAVKIGRRAFSRQHPDAEGLFVLNTILGGYFGSRLMTNIREKKGYTYNIYSTLDTLLHDGCFYIATEVSPEKAQAAVRAIFSEMKKLRTQPVGPEELAMVRNYLLGMLLNGLDGPLNTSDVVRSYILEDTPFDKFDSLVHTIQTIDATRLQELANVYLRKEDFWTVVVG